MDCFFQSISGYNLENQDREQLLQTAQNLLAEAQALSSRIATINEVATAINRSLNVDEILRVVGKQAKWLLDFEHFSVYLCLNNNKGFVTLFGSPVEFNDSAFSDNNPFSRALKTSQSQLFQSGENCEGIGTTTAFLSAFSSQLIVPLQSDRIVIGTLNFASNKTQAYTHEDVRIGYLLGLQISAAIRNANSFAELNLLYDQLRAEKQKSEQLLLNVLPGEIANELKRDRKVKPVHYESASVVFTDFKNFTKLAEQMTPQELVDELDYCFSYFDTIAETHNLEKLKTIGDSYMCVGGIPTPNSTHAIDTVLAALQIQAFMNWRRIEKLQKHQPYWDIRIGIHSGPVLAGVIGKKKFAYDIWGDTVNTASRMESCGVAGGINISAATFELVKNLFEFEHRGKIPVKNKGDIDMYLVTGIKPELSLDPLLLLPNEKFNQIYSRIQFPEARVST